jgi:hypothetical protein
MGYSYNVLGPVCCACAFVSATCFSRASPLLVSEPGNPALGGELSRCDDHDLLILLLLFFPLVPLPVLLLSNAMDDMPDSGQLLSLSMSSFVFRSRRRTWNGGLATQRNAANP